MMVIDFEDTEDNKDFNILLLIREVKFATNFPPFHEFKINKVRSTVIENYKIKPKFDKKSYKCFEI